MSNSTSDAPEKDDYMNHPTTCAKWVAYDDNHRRFHPENECTCQLADQRVHQQSDGELPDVEKYIAEASALSNRGRFEEAFNVLVNTLRSLRTRAHAPVDEKE